MYFCRLNLELHQVKEMMTSPVVTIESREKVSKVCNLLLKTTFGGFPVVKQSEKGEIYEGLITRLDITLGCISTFLLFKNILYL